MQAGRPVTLIRMSHGELLMKRFLDILLPFDHLDNDRPGWLKGLELDRYYPSLCVGFEFDGDYHLRPTEFSPDVSSVRRRDKTKARLCWLNGVKLVRVEASDLEYTRLSSLLKRKSGFRVREKYGRAGRPPRPSKRRKTPRLDRSEEERLRELNKEAVAYRSYLNEAFAPHISSRRRRSSPRRNAEHFWDERGIS